MEKIKEVIKRLEPLVMSGELTGEALQQRLLDECKLITPSDNRKIVVYKDGSYKLFSKIDPTFEYEGDIDWLVTIEVPAPSPSQVLTAEQVLKKCLLKWCPEKERPDFEKDWKGRVDNDVFNAINEAMQEYSTLQTQQLQEEHQKTVEMLVKSVKLARNEAIQECIAIAEKELEDTDDHAGYVACDNVINKLKEKLKIS